MSIGKFETIARKAHLYTLEQIILEHQEHPFENRNIHNKLPKQVRKLFDDSYYSQSIFEACKYIDKLISKLSQSDKTGYQLMMDSFNENNPKIKINNLNSLSEKDEQAGYKFIFSGSVLAIRNPRGHEYIINDTIEDCLDYLSFISILMRRLEKSGHKLI